MVHHDPIPSGGVILVHDSDPSVNLQAGKRETHEHHAA